MSIEFKETPLPGAFELVSVPHTDERGTFGRTYDGQAFRDRGLNPDVSQGSFATNTFRHTLRGMHYQSAPHQETKLVRCTQGSAYDVIVDLRPGSHTYRHWHAVTLSATNHMSLYVPEGFAHGYLTLEPETEVCYQISSPYHPDSARGIRWDDPAIGIVWPSLPAVISQRDTDYALLG